ncbi:MAG: hypothetical protein WCI21_04580 [Alphaproteobacteria bacterium]
MTDAARLILSLILAGAILTAGAAIWSWWTDRERALTRLSRRVLGGRPDALCISPARSAAVALRIETGKILLLWNGGAGALLYPIEALEGAELIVDHAVVARAFRGEPRRALDHINREARQATLRLVFDNPRSPEFALDLWLPEDARRRAGSGPTAAIEEGRAWLARTESLLRRPRSEPAVARPAAPNGADDQDELPF